MRTNYRKLVAARKKTATRKIVEEYLKNPNADGEITSYMDAFYQQMLKDSANDNTNSSFNVETMVANVFGLFQAGADDASIFHYHGLFLMAVHPEVQAKVQEELDVVVGRNRLPSIIDKPLLHYTEAVLNEILRYVCLIPANPIRMCEGMPAPFLIDIHVIDSNLVETTIGGYRIPKDAACIANLFNATRDERFFKNPDKFDPKNFLDDDGKFVRKEASIPFSVGPRSCFGEPFMRMAYFLYMTATLQSYTLSEPPNKKLGSEAIESVVRMLLPHEICARKRTWKYLKIKPQTLSALSPKLYVCLT